MSESPRTPESEARSPERARTGGFSAFYELTKPGIVLFVMLTTGVSFYLAEGGRIVQFWVLLHTVGGTGLATAGALALNHYLERDADALMRRTRKRPLPDGRLRPRQALLFGLILVFAGVGHLAYWVGPLPAALTAASVIAYDWIYTPLKRRSYAATLVGAIPGALPTLIGWSAATGNVTLGALVLFGIAFLWQLPHVLALAWMYKEDYAAAGFLMSPPSDATGSTIGRHMVAYSVVLLPMSIAPSFLELTGSIYLIGAALLGIFAIAFAVAAARDMTRQAARRVFFLSLLYHPVILGLMLINPVRG